MPVAHNGCRHEEDAYRLMYSPSPRIVVLAGPNGAGKSTAAPELLRGVLSVTQFVNADVIARGLAGFDPQSAALLAGRVMLGRLHELADSGTSFAFETTMASRSLAPLLVKATERGYEIAIVYVALVGPDLAVARVADRVRLGGHDVPEMTIRRRFHRGLSNFFCLYMPIAAQWQVLDNSTSAGLSLIARGVGVRVEHVEQALQWRSMRIQAGEHVAD